jgi:hypothetical protein
MLKLKSLDPEARSKATFSQNIDDVLKKGHSKRDSRLPDVFRGKRYLAQKARCEVPAEASQGHEGNRGNGRAQGVRGGAKAAVADNENAKAHEQRPYG